MVSQLTHSTTQQQPNTVGCSRNYLKKIPRKVLMLKQRKTDIKALVDVRCIIGWTFFGKVMFLLLTNTMMTPLWNIAIFSPLLVCSYISNHTNHTIFILAKNKIKSSQIKYSLIHAQMIKLEPSFYKFKYNFKANSIPDYLFDNFSNIHKL